MVFSRQTNPVYSYLKQYVIRLKVSIKCDEKLTIAFFLSRKSTHLHKAGAFSRVYHYLVIVESTIIIIQLHKM